MIRRPASGEPLPYRLSRTRPAACLPLGLALASALAALPGHTLPLDDEPQVAVYISGSSAQDEILAGLMRLRAGVAGAPNICQDGSLDIYSGDLEGTGQRLFYCLSDDNVSGVDAGLRLAVFKSSGGSGEGVQPVLDNRAMPFMSVRGLRAQGCSAQTRVLPTGDLAAYTEHQDCVTAPDAVVPDAGISDLEPALLSPADVSALVSNPLLQLVWGLPVSKNLRNALQAVQGLVPAEVAHDDPARELPQNMPGLSSTQVSSILAGSVTEWSAFEDGAGNPLSESLLLAEQRPARDNLSGTTPGAYRPASRTGEPIYVCRRIESSGTQIAYATHYLRRGCTANAPAFVTPDDGSDLLVGGSAAELLDRPDPAGRVFAGIGTSDVEACLDIHDDHNRWALGIFSTENIGNNSSREYRHIRVDGSAPTLLNAYNGRWRHVSTASLQWSGPALAASGDSGLQSMLAFIARHMGQPAVLRSLNRDFRHPWGQGGYLSITSGMGSAAQQAITAETLAAHPVAGVSNALAGEPENCRVPLLTGVSSVAAP